MKPLNPKSIPSSRWLMFSVAAVLLAGISYGAFSGVFSSGSATASQALTFPAAHGPLTISVTESGTIRSRQQEILKSEVEGQTTIIYLIPEGTLVKAGELLVELDASRLQDQKIEQEIRVQNAEAAFIRARENLQVVRNQNQSDLSRAELDLRFALEDLQKYIEGDFPKELKEAQNRITIAEAELKRAEDKLDGSRRLFNEEFISESEFRADELAVQKAELDMELAEVNLNLLKDWTNQRQLAELKSDIEQTEMALDRVRMRTTADLVQAEADLRAKESEFRQQQNQLARTVQQIRNTRIVAPTEGLVVYATSGQGGGFRGNAEPLAEGQQVRERQDLIYLPTASSVMAEVKVHESALDKVRMGMPVRVTVDALPGRMFTGRVARIAPLPDAQSMWMNPDLKVYHTEIHIDGDGSELRTGMSCRAEVIIDHYASATYVPVQSILRVGGQPVVYVHDGRQSVMRPIELGLDNNRMARVISGLQAGERVLLNPPLAEAEKEGLALEEQTAPAAEAAMAQAGAAGTNVVVPAVEDSADGAPRGQGEGQRRRAPRGEGAEDGAAEPGEAQADQPQQRRRQLEGMSEEQREEMRRRFENMTPEQRDEARRQFGGGGGGRRGAGAEQ